MNTEATSMNAEASTEQSTTLSECNHSLLRCSCVTCWQQSAMSCRAGCYCLSRTPLYEAPKQNQRATRSTGRRQSANINVEFSPQLSIRYMCEEGTSVLLIPHYASQLITQLRREALQLTLKTPTKRYVLQYHTEADAAAAFNLFAASVDTKTSLTEAQRSTLPVAAALQVENAGTS